jgi:hypothetical protein
MSVQGLDRRQLEETSNTVEELKAAFLALQEAMKQFIFLYPPPANSTLVGVSGQPIASDKAFFPKEFDRLYLECLTKLRGVDVFTNLSIGKVYLSKYDRTDKVRRWEVLENAVSDNKSS